MDTSPDILNQLQEIVAPGIIYTLENIVLGMSSDRNNRYYTDPNAFRSS